MIRLHYLLSLFLLFFMGIFLRFDTHAQQDEQMSIYMYNPLYFNPAYAGSRDAVSIAAVGRFQWLNYKGAPRSQWLSVHSPLQAKALGVGLHMVNDKIGKRHRTAIYGDMSSSIALDSKGENRISVGLSLGMDVIGFDFSDAIVRSVLWT